MWNSILFSRLSKRPREVYALGPDTARVPVYDCAVCCGQGAELFDVSRTYFDLAAYCGISREATYLVRAQGDSMSPVIEDGDLMVVDHDRQPQNGDIILAYIDDGDVMAKYYFADKQEGTLRLVPKNRAYPERVFPLYNNKVRSLGVVRHVIRSICRRPQLHIMKMRPPGEAAAGSKSINRKGNGPVALVAAIDADMSRGAPTAEAVDVKTLGAQFGARFKGAGGGPDYFNDCLLGDLKMPWTDRQIAIIAYMIYEGGWLVGRPDTFTAWYKAFCQMVGRAFHPAYRPCKLSPTLQMQRRFYYLKKG